MRVKPDEVEEPLKPPFMTDVLGSTKALQEFTIQSSKESVPSQHLIDGLLSISSTLTCLHWTLVKPSHFADPFGVVLQLPHLVHLTIKNVGPEAANLDRLGSSLGRQLRSLTIHILDKHKRRSRNDLPNPIPTTRSYSMDLFSNLESLALRFGTEGYECRFLICLKSVSIRPSKSFAPYPSRTSNANCLNRYQDKGSFSLSWIN